MAPSIGTGGRPEEATRVRQVLYVLVVVAVWGGLRWVFWIGFAGSDDALYLLYAHDLDRVPRLFWEFRMATVLLARSILATLGPSEVAICLPSLAASAAVLTSVACFVGWPRVLDWRTTGAVLLAAVMPIDVTMASYLVPTMMAAGLLAAASVCLLRGERRLQYLGALLLALAVWTHEISVFYVAILSATCLALDRRRYAAPVAACLGMVAAIVLVEAGVYAAIAGDPLARWRAAGGHASGAALDPLRFADSALRFYLWPLQNLIASKQFGCDLLLLAVAGVFAWPRLDVPQRILLLTAGGYWLWLGYGTQVPWAYRPRSRSFHYYVCLTFPVAALLPDALHFALAARVRTAIAVVAAVIAVHLVSLVAGGRWGQSVEVSRELLAYASARPQMRFLTDGNTMREMYFANGLRLPANVATVPGSNWDERGGRRGTTAGPVDAVLLNHEHEEIRRERGFVDYVDENAGRSLYRLPVVYKPALAPLARLLGTDELAVKNRGGEVLAVQARPRR